MAVNSKEAGPVAASPETSGQRGTLGPGTPLADCSLFYSSVARLETLTDSGGALCTAYSLLLDCWWLHTELLP